MRHSQIETFRIRNHGDDTLRLLAESADGVVLNLIREVEKGFFIGRNFDTAPGGYESNLTVDYLLAGTTSLEMIAVTHVDLAKRDNSRYQRWSVETNTPPTIDNDRFVCSVRADFRNAQPVSGTLVIDPEAPIVLPVFNRFIFEQPTPASVWIINHNLGEKPTIELFTVGGAEMDAEVVHVTNNQARVYFVTPMAGSARCI